MHKQSTWHLQFILVTENLIDDKFRKWQIFNIGLNNLSLLILIIGFFFQLGSSQLPCSSAPSAARWEKKSLPYLFLMDFH